MHVQKRKQELLMGFGKVLDELAISRMRAEREFEPSVYLVSRIREHGKLTHALHIDVSYSLETAPSSEKPTSSYL